MPQNIFEGFNEIKEQQKQSEENISNKLDKLIEMSDKRNNTVNQAVKKRNEQFSLTNFIRRSVHSYVWLGSQSDFKKGKFISIGLVLSSIIMMIITTIVSIYAFGLYSTFTLFENIWLILMCFVLKYVIVAKKEYPTLDYSFNSFEKFKNIDGVEMNTGKRKVKYRLFHILACISFIFNSIVAIDESKMPALLIILELATMILSIVTMYIVDGFFIGYMYIKMSGLNDSGSEYVSIYYDTSDNKFYTEGEYQKRWGAVL